MEYPIQCTVCCIKLDTPESRLKCGKCYKRIYCSKSCQVTDWTQSHKHWCCKSGEINYDYVIKPSEQFEGLGVFALRDFAKSEKIMASRAFIVSNLHKINRTQQNAILQLQPEKSDLIADKFDFNALDCGPRESPVLSLHASRINHQCPFVENCCHLWIKEHEILIIYAKQNIKSGEELTISYINSFDSYSELSDKWGINCNCDGCSLPTNMEYQKKISQLNNFVVTDTILPNLRLDSVDKLIKLYGEKNIPERMYTRVYWDAHNLYLEKQDYDKAKEMLSKCIGLEQNTIGFETDNIKNLKQRMFILGLNK